MSHLFLTPCKKTHLLDPLGHYQLQVHVQMFCPLTPLVTRQFLQVLMFLTHPFETQMVDLLVIVIHPLTLRIMCATKLKCSPITHHRVLSLPQVLPVLFLIFFLVIIYPLLVVSSCRQSCLMMSPNILRRLSNMTIGEQQCPKSFGHLRPTKLGHYNLCLPRRNQLVVSGFTR